MQRFSSHRRAFDRVNFASYHHWLDARLWLSFVVDSADQALVDYLSSDHLGFGSVMNWPRMSFHLSAVCFRNSSSMSESRNILSQSSLHRNGLQASMIIVPTV